MKHFLNLKSDARRKFAFFYAYLLNVKNELLVLEWFEYNNPVLVINPVGKTVLSLSMLYELMQNQIGHNNILSDDANTTA